MSSRIRVALIYGSTWEGRFCDTVAGWVAAEIACRNEYTLDVIDPATLDLPIRHQRGHHAAVGALRQCIAEADAFVVVTPEYNRGYPAALKYLIDSVSAQWQAKPVAFVSYGGISGGLRAVEQLRLVFAELHAVTIRDCVSFANAWNKFDAAAGCSTPMARGRPWQCCWRGCAGGRSPCGVRAMRRPTTRWRHKALGDGARAGPPSSGTAGCGSPRWRSKQRFQRASYENGRDGPQQRRHGCASRQRNVALMR
jgi:NAD(P)H-dependent FMN reductase